MDSSPALVEVAALDPQGVLVGPTPRLIDEWQLAPSLWNVLRHEIDARGETGQFILSGSATPPDDIRRHTGAGRLARLRMRTMTLGERGRSSHHVSLRALAQGRSLTGVRSELSYRDLAEQAVRGGWPGALHLTTGQARTFTASYLRDLTASELQAATGTTHDPVRVQRLLVSLARNVATEATITRLATDAAGDGASVNRTTVSTYLDALTRVFAVEEVAAWSPQLRSRTRLRQQAKIHLADPSLACAALRVTPERLARDPEYFGQIFESMAVHDLLVLAEAEGGSVFHFRDESGLEVDCVLELADGRWAAIEIKLGTSRVPEAERALLRLRDTRVDLDSLGEPAFLAVVTGSEFGYTLPSGVHVVPLACLAA